MLSIEQKYQNKLSKVTTNLITSSSPAIKNIPEDTDHNRMLIRGLFDISHTANYKIDNLLKNQINSVVKFPSDDYIDRFNKLVNWIGNRGESFEYLTLKYGESGALERLKIKSESVKGDKNPAYQHGGKFSPWSDKFCKGGDYEDRLKDLKIKSSNTRRDNPQNTNTRIEYYTKQGLSESQAKIALSDRQSTFSKETCIEKYGEGMVVWKDRQIKWQNTINAKPQAEINRINRLKINSSNVSKVSQKLFASLNIKESNYFEQGGEFQICISDSIYYSVDFIYGNKIIEFLGDYWHCNPAKYSEDFIHPTSNMTANELWKKDLIRKKNLIELGYEVFEVWESDYCKNPEDIILRCKEFCDVE